MQNLNLRRGGGQYFQDGDYPVFVERGAHGWRLYAKVPGFREAFLVDKRHDRMWLKRLQESCYLLRVTGLDGYRFESRREALETFRAMVEVADLGGA